EVAVVVAPGAVTGEVDVLDLAPVLVAVAVIVAVHGAQHAWPRTAHDEVAALASRDFVAVGVDHSGVDAEHRDASRARLTGVDTRQGGDHDAAGLGLPPSIDDGAAVATYHAPVPHPRLGVDGLTHGADETQAGEVVSLG